MLESDQIIICGSLKVLFNNQASVLSGLKNTRLCLMFLHLIKYELRVFF